MSDTKAPDRSVESKAAEARTQAPREIAVVVGGLTLLTLAMYGDVLLSFGTRVLSHPTGDTALYFAAFREFAASEMRSGNLPLWNPHVFSGAPFFGGFQSSLLYPPNIIYLLFPIRFALNLDICIHTFLVGVFMYAWVRYRGLHAAAAFFAAGIIMFCGAYALRVLAGQLTMLSTLAYVPLLFLAIDGVFKDGAARKPLLGWTLLGVAATSLQVVAGYPQAVFMTAVAAAVYCVLRLPFAKQHLRVLASLALIGAWPVGISAVQLWTGVEMGAESIRADGGTYYFSSSFSFPIENLLTIIVGSFFGDRMHLEYWGSWNFWDVTPYLGVSTVLLAIYGGLFGPWRLRQFSAILAVLFLFISFGRYTPFHEWLYDNVPGFDLFRSPSKFLFHATFFGVMLAAIGVDTLLRKPAHAKGLAAAALALAVALGIGAGWVLQSHDDTTSEDAWEKIVRYEKDLEEGYIWTAELEESTLGEAAALATKSLGLTAAGALLLAVLLFLVPRSNRVLYAVLGLALLDVFLFARLTRQTYDYPAPEARGAVAEAYASTTRRDRVLDISRFDNSYRNYALRVGGHAIWGYDPVILKRYGEYMAYAGGGLWHADELEEHVFTWGSDPVGVGITLGFNAYTPLGMERGTRLLNLLRTRYVVRTAVAPEYMDFLMYLKKKSAQIGGPIPEREQDQFEEEVYAIPDAYPESLFMQDYRILPADMDMLAAMTNMDTDLSRTVFLESEPDPRPSAPGTPIAVTPPQVSNDSTDGRDFAFAISEPALMLFTDAYSAGWRAVSLDGSDQDAYTVMPANYTLMAIPLAAGQHHFRLEYAPDGFRYGRWVSIISTLLFIAVAAQWCFTQLRGEPVPEDAAP